jgi:hypothetical protein
MSQKARRRWLTFSLRSLFVAVLIVAAYFAGWRSALWTADREKEAAVQQALEDLQAAEERQRARANVPGVYVPELDLVVMTGPKANVDRVRVSLAPLTAPEKPTDREAILEILDLLPQGSAVSPRAGVAPPPRPMRSSQQQP